MDRYQVIKEIIDDWFSYNLKLQVIDIMPHLIFLYEENQRLKEDNQNKWTSWRWLFLMI